MPLPLILGIAAGVAGLAGVGAGINGAIKMSDANDTMKRAEKLNNQSIAKFETTAKKAETTMDDLGMYELNILKNFENFSDIFEKIKNRPKFSEYKKNGVNIPEYNGEELKNVYVGATALISAAGGAGAGVAGGVAAGGATTAAVMALGTASTGTAISSLGGVAATNATLAALGGGSLAAGGGGMALGSLVLGGATLGVGLLIGGIIFNAAGSGVSDKAYEALSQAQENEKQVNKVCEYLDDLTLTAMDFKRMLERLNSVYISHLNTLGSIVYVKNDYNSFTYEEKKCLENTVLLVGILNKSCKVQLVLKANNEKDMNKVNKEGVETTRLEADNLLRQVA